MTDLVATYWRYLRGTRGDRAQRLAADADFWAWDEADPVTIGAGPLEDLVVAHGRDLETALAARCRQSSRWREAMAAVWCDDDVRAALPLLLPFVR